MEDKIEVIYKMIKEIKDEMIGKNLIKRTITEAVNEEMDRIRQEIQSWKEEELKSLVSSVVRKEVKNLVKLLPLETNLQKTEKKKSYSEDASNKQEAIFIIKPVKENDHQ